MKRTETVVNVRMPNGKIPQRCVSCNREITGNEGSIKTRDRVAFVHTYEEGRWIKTEVFHAGCYETTA